MSEAIKNKTFRRLTTLECGYVRKRWPSISPENYVLFTALLTTNMPDETNEIMSKDLIREIADSIVDQTITVQAQSAFISSGVKIIATRVDTYELKTPIGENVVRLFADIIIERSSLHYYDLSDANIDDVKIVPFMSISTEKVECSICGNQHGSQESCDHVPGMKYENKMCYSILKTLMGPVNVSITFIPKTKKTTNEASIQCDHCEEKSNEQPDQYINYLREIYVWMVTSYDPKMDQSVVQGIANCLDGELLIQGIDMYKKLLTLDFKE